MYFDFEGGVEISKKGSNGDGMLTVRKRRRAAANL